MQAVLNGVRNGMYYTDLIDVIIAFIYLFICLFIYLPIQQTPQLEDYQPAWSAKE